MFKFSKVLFLGTVASIIVGGSALYYFGVYQKTQDPTLLALQSMAEKDSLYLDQNKVLGSSLDYEVFTTVLTNDGSYSFAQINDGTLSNDKFTGSTTFQFPDGELATSDTPGYFPIFALGDGEQTTASILDNAITVLKLKSGEYLPLKIIKGTIVSGRLTGIIEAKTIDTGYMVFASIQNRKIAQGYISPTSSYISATSRISSYIVLRETELRHQSLTQDDKSKRVLGATTVAPKQQVGVFSFDNSAFIINPATGTYKVVGGLTSGGVPSNPAVLNQVNQVISQNSSATLSQTPTVNVGTQITNAVIPLNAIITPQSSLLLLGPNSISSQMIQNLAVTTGDLADLAVTTGKIANGAITADKLASSLTTSTTINDGAVGTTKISDGAVTDSKIAQVSSPGKVLGAALQLSGSGGLTNSSGISLLTSCSNGQVLKWNGGSWACATVSSGGSGGVWGGITGTLSDQTDLQSAFDAKANSSSLGTLSSQNSTSVAITGGSITGLTSLSATNFSGSSSGTNTGDQTITLTGDVAGSGTGSFATTIGNGKVTNSKLVNSSLTITPGTGMTGGGSVSLGGSTTLGLASNNISQFTNDSNYITGLSWGQITGTLSNQTDLQTALNAKASTANFSGSSSGTNTGDNAVNSNYSSDYRAANFVAGTNYLAPNGSAASLTSFPTLNQNTTGTASNITGVLGASSFPAQTGDVTNTQGSLANAISSGAVTLSKMANLAANSIIGNNTGISATPIALTATQVKSLLAIANTDVSGLGTMSTQNASGVAITGGTISGLTSIAAGNFSGSSSGTNTGDNSANSTYASDYRAANFIAGTNYLAPNGSAASLTSFPTLNQNTTGTAAGLSTVLVSTSGGSGINNAGTLTWGAGGTLGTAAYTAASAYATAAQGTLATNALPSSSFTDAAVSGKLITGYVSGAGTVAATDTILQAIQKLNGNNATNANLTGVVTSVGNATSIANGAITNAMLVNGAVANLSGTNTGDNSANSTYASDYRAANFVAGTNYLAPNGSAASLTSFPTFNQSTTGTASNITGVLGASSFPAQTGDVTNTQGNLSNAITSGAVTLGKMANLAANSIIGNNTGISATPIALTAAQVKTLLAIANTDVSGLGTLSTQNASGVAVTGGTVAGLTGFGIRSSGTGAFDLTIANSENLTAGRTLTITTGNAARTLTLTGDASITGTNTGDNSANSTYASDYRAANFVAGTNYLAPNGSAASLTSFPTFNQNTTGTAAGLSTVLVSTSGGSGVNNAGTLTWGAGGTLGTAAYTAASAYATSAQGTLATNALPTSSFTDAAVSGKLLTGYVSGAGTVAATDSILAAIQKLNGNDATNANLTGVVTSVGNATSIANGAITNAMLANAAVANLSGTNTGDNAVNSNYSSDYRAANFVAGTNYLAPNGSAASLTSFPTFNQSTTGTASNITGVLGASSFPAMTGDVTNTQGSLSNAIASGAVTLGKMANLAANSIIGNNTGISATPIALTAAQVKTLLAIANTDVSGLGTMSTQNANAVSITGGTHTGLTSLGIRSTGTGAFDLTINNTENLTAGRTLTITTGDVARTLTLTGNASITGTNTGDNSANSTYASDYRAANFVAGTNYLAPNGSAASLTSFPTFNQNTTGTASNITGVLGASSFPAQTGDVTNTQGSLANAISSGAVTLAKMSNLAANSIIGNNTGISATPIALTAAQVKTLLAIANTDVSGLGTLSTQNSNNISVTGGSLSGLTSVAATTFTGALTGNASGTASNITGVLGASSFPAQTGDVTNTQGSLANAIASGAVTLGKMANLAANSIIGNNTGSSATPIALTAAQVKTLLAIANTDVSGLGTMSTQNASAVAITGGTVAGLTGFGVRSSGTGAFDLTINNTENLTAGRTLTVVTGDAARSLTLTGNASITGTNTGDNSANSTYSSDFRAANFVAGTNYLAPNGSAASLTSFPTFNQSTTGTASNITGVLGAASFPAQTGDVTNTQGSLANAIASGAVTLGKMASLAANSIIGNNTGVGATPIALTTAQVKTLLAIANTDVSGLGTMSTQNAASVAITGGSATGLTGLTFTSGNFNQSAASTGTFQTGGGAVTLNGVTTLAAGKSLIITGAGGAPTATSGTIWYDTTANKFDIVENGAVKVLCNTTDNGCGTGGGGGVSTVKEGGTNIVTSATAMDFTAADFVITAPGGGVAGVAIDYANSNITRTNQAQTITGGWTFNSAATTFTTAINSNGGITTAAGTALALTSGNNGAGTAGNITLDVGTSTSSNGSILIGTQARNQTITIGNSTGGTITIGASSGSDLALNDAQWSVTGAGAATFGATSSLTLGTSTSAAGAVIFKNATNSNTATIQSGVTSSSYTWTLPTADSAGCLQSNGSGTLSLATCGDIKTQTITTTGAGTYTKPAGAIMVIVEAVGAGGGGGGGASNTGTVVRMGGAGGGGGAYNTKTYNASDLGSTENYSVGVGGTLGTAGASGAIGGNGGIGGATTFGTTVMLTAGGGGGGRGGAITAVAGGGGGGGGTSGSGTSGTTAVGAGGAPTGATTVAVGGQGGTGSITATAGVPAEYGGGGGGGHTSTPANSPGGTSLHGGGGGGVGGGSTSAPALIAGTAGGATGTYNTTGGGGGAAGTSSSTPTVGTPGAVGASSVRAGAGGGGGGGTITASTAGAAGGNGGAPGGGAGGGGVGSNTASGGAGGTGGRGELRIWTIKGTGADLAEIYGTNDSSITSGDVVALDSTLKAGVKKTQRAYDPTVFGVISTSPSLVMGTLEDADATPVMVALSGRVPIKVSMENGPIQPGDLLTPSSTPGVAMKATKAGQIIGQAMIGFEGIKGTSTENFGLILAFIKNSTSNGQTLNDFVAGLTPTDATPSANISGNDSAALLQLVSQKDQLAASSNLSEINTDRLTAGLEIITPKLLADEINVRDLTTSGLKVTGSTMFLGNVEFTFTPLFNSDTAGFAVIKQGDSEVTINFDKEYVDNPVVVVTPNQSVLYSLVNSTTKGFTIKIDNTSASDIKFNWIALAVKDARTVLSASTSVSDASPSGTLMPSASPSVIPSDSPTATPEATATPIPEPFAFPFTASPSASPIETPIASPSATP